MLVYIPQPADEEREENLTGCFQVAQPCCPYSISPNQTGPPDRRESCEVKVMGLGGMRQTLARPQGFLSTPKSLNFIKSLFNVSPEWTLSSPASFSSGRQPIFSAS